MYRAFSRDVTAAISVFQKKETVAILVYIVPNQSFGIRILFLCKNHNLIKKKIPVGHVSESVLYELKTVASLLKCIIDNTDQLNFLASFLVPL